MVQEEKIVLLPDSSAYTLPCRRLKLEEVSPAKQGICPEKTDISSPEYSHLGKGLKQESCNFHAFCSMTLVAG